MSDVDEPDFAPGATRTPDTTGRRKFLVHGAAASLLALDGIHSASAAGTGDRMAATPWTHEQGKPILTPAYGMPSPHESDVVRRPTDLTPTALSSWSFTPLQDLDGIITPNGLFFERHHGGVPAISPDAHRLVIHGMVERPLVLSMDDIVRLPSVSRIHFLECSGNTLTEWKAPKEKTVQGTHGLLSCAEWTGVPLSVIADQVGLRTGVKWMLAEGADAAVMDRSIPLAKVLDDALLVYSQNG